MEHVSSTATYAYNDEGKWWVSALGGLMNDEGDTYTYCVREGGRGDGNTDSTSGSPPSVPGGYLHEIRQSVCIEFGSLLTSCHEKSVIHSGSLMAKWISRDSHSLPILYVFERIGLTQDIKQTRKFKCTNRSDSKTKINGSDRHTAHNRNIFCFKISIVKIHFCHFFKWICRVLSSVGPCPQ